MAQVSAPAPSLADAAQLFSKAGLSVLPIGSLEDKSPALDSWAPLATTPATPDHARAWFIANGHPASPGLGIICGRVSGGLTVIDFDTDGNGDTIYGDWWLLVDALRPGLIERLVAVATPSAGRHLYFRCDAVDGNEKLACTAAKKVLIETRGERGYVLAPPTPGYAKLYGSLSAIPTISVAERDLLLHAARSFDASPHKAGHTGPASTDLPGDAYNAGATLESVTELLTRHGWQLVRVGPDNRMLRRPGKDRGVSASVRLIGGVPIFYSFSTNAPGVPSQCGVSPFGLYASLEHNGNYSAAAQALSPLVKPRPAPVSPQAAPADEPEKVDWRSLIRSANDLRKRVFPELSWVVPNILPVGLTLVAGAPKTGKSLLGWGLAVALATGGAAFGSIPVQQRRVLYLVMEDGERLVRKRLDRLAHADTDLEYLTYAQQWPRLTEGGTEAIGEWWDQNPGGLVIIDTYQSLRGSVKDAPDSYQADYGALKPLANLAHDKDASALIVHHTSKKQHEDPMQAINGSNGITGVCDTLAVLQRVRFGEDVTLSVVGRDLDCDMKYALAFDSMTGMHTMIGPATEVGATQNQRAIVDALRYAGEPQSAQQLAVAVGREDDSAFRHQLGRLVDQGTLRHAAWKQYCLPGWSDNSEIVTFGVEPPAEPQSDTIEPPEVPVAQGGLSNVTISLSHTGSDKVTFAGIDEAVQKTPCAGCGKAFTKKMSADKATEWYCGHCGSPGTIA